MTIELDELFIPLFDQDIYIYITILGVSKMGVPPVIIPFNGYSLINQPCLQIPISGIHRIYNYIYNYTWILHDVYIPIPAGLGLH